MTTGHPRYAIYWSPADDSPLARFGDSWLGRDATGAAVPDRPDLPDWTVADIDALTAVPAPYGFHATLKPPFRLREGVTLDHLIAATAEVAGRFPAFDMGPLEVMALGKFITLQPAAPPQVLAELAATCVRDLDRFRAPPGEEELTRRRSAHLTPRQDELLTQWGYPYVFDQFRFHMTLTGAIEDEAARARVLQALSRHLKSADILATATQQIGAISVYIEREPGAAFERIRICPMKTT